MTVSGTGDAGQHAANGSTAEEQGMNLPTDQEMQDVIDFLSGFNMGKSQQASPLVKRRNSVASSNAADLKPPGSVAPPTSQAPLLRAVIPLAQNLPQQPQLQQQQQPPQLPTTPKQQQQTTVPPQPQAPVQPSPSPQTLQYYQHLLQQSQQPSPVSPQLPSQQPQALPPQQRAPGKWPQAPPGGLSPIGHMTQWTLPDLSSDLYSLGLVSTYMDSVMSEVLGHKAPPGPRNNTWPNREQSEQGMFGVLGDTMPFDPAGESWCEHYRCV